MRLPRWAAACLCATREDSMRTAKLATMVCLAALGSATLAHAQGREVLREALLLRAPAPTIQNFTPAQGVFACHWNCSGNMTEIFCPSGTHCSCTCAGPQPLCACVIPP